MEEFWTWAPAALGLAVGPLLARASVRMAGGATTRPRRMAGFAAACAGLALWAQMLHPGPLGVAGALMGWALLLLAVLDAEHFWLPLPLTAGLIVTGLLVDTAQGLDALGAGLIGAAAGFLALSALAWAYRRLRGREGLGGGDAWLLAGGGAWVGWIGLPTVLVWAAAGGLAAVGVLALTGRRIGADQHLPFGVGLAAGIWLTWLYGPFAG
jgi:leader peptidase (prepilin peptidase)/N-methyltransferase